MRCRTNKTFAFNEPTARPNFFLHNELTEFIILFLLKYPWMEFVSEKRNFSIHLQLYVNPVVL